MFALVKAAHVDRPLTHPRKPTQSLTHAHTRAARRGISGMGSCSASSYRRATAAPPSRAHRTSAAVLEDKALRLEAKLSKKYGVSGIPSFYKVFYGWEPPFYAISLDRPERSTVT